MSFKRTTAIHRLLVAVVDAGDVVGDSLLADSPWLA
jgi:hypothetical protein